MSGHTDPFFVIKLIQLQRCRPLPVDASPLILERRCTTLFCCFHSSLTGYLRHHMTAFRENPPFQKTSIYKYMYMYTYIYQFTRVSTVLHFAQHYLFVVYARARIVWSMFFLRNFSYVNNSIRLLAWEHVFGRKKRWEVLCVSCKYLSIPIFRRRHPQNTRSHCMHTRVAAIIENTHGKIPCGARPLK